MTDFYRFESAVYGVTSLCVLKGRSTRFPLRCQSVSFVVWPYINNVKVMISRLKAPVLPCPPRPPHHHTHPHTSVEPIAVQQKRESPRASRRNGGIPASLRKSGRKQRAILRKHLIPVVPGSLPSAPEVCSEQNDG